MAKTIAITDFLKLDLRVGRVVKAEEVAQSQKLIKLTVSFGDLGERTIFAGIKKWYTPADLEGKSFAFVYNLEPKKMVDGEESQGMIMAAEDEDSGNCVLLSFEKDIVAGAKIH